MSYRVSHRISALALAIFAMVNAEDIISFPISIKESNGNRRIDASTHGYLQGARRRLQEISPAAFPVYQEYGAYYVDIHVGSPPQRQTVLVDTGSENTGIPCTGCDNCGYHTDPNFNQILSESFRHLNCSDCMKGLCNANNDTCTVRSYYAEKSGWRGNEVEDSVSISPFTGEINSDKFRLKFTCMKENDGEFKKQVSNGIMGMNLDKTAFWSQMYDQGIIKSRKFSLCLNTHPLAKHMIGALTLGGVDERLGHRASDMSYMDFTDSSSLFQVQIRKVYIYPNSGKRSKVVDGKIDFTKNDTVALIASKDLFNDGGVKLDSGTTGTLMTPKVKEAFVEAWEKATGKNFPFGPIYLTPGELKTWPTIIFQMEGTQKIKTNSKSEEQKKLVFDENFPDDLLVALPPSHYMQLNLGSGLYSPILKFDGNHGEGSLLGSNFMRTHDVLFDMETGTIGMIKSDCNFEDMSSEAGKRRYIKVPDPYAGFGQIYALHRDDLCLKEHHYLFCIEIFAAKYSHGIISLLFLLILSLIFFACFVRDEQKFLNDEQLSKPLLEKSA